MALFNISPLCADGVYGIDWGGGSPVGLFGVGMLAPDDVQVLALIREWHIEGFDNEIITVFRHAWLRIGEYLSDVIEFLGGDRFPDTLPDCFKDPREHYYKKYHGLLFAEAQ